MSAIRGEADLNGREDFGMTQTSHQRISLTKRNWHYQWCAGEQKRRRGAWHGISNGWMRYRAHEH